MASGAAPLRGRQAQAAQNDELILQAAREVFLADPTAPISAVAEPLAERGFNYVGADIDTDALKKADHELSQRTDVVTLELDVSDRQRYAAAADTAEQRLGPIGILCNNAATHIDLPISEMSYEAWDVQLDITLGGQINGIQTFLPRMLGRNKSAHIVNTSSQAGLVASHGGRLYMYNMAKSDVERGEHRMRRVEAAREMMLPINRTEEKLLNGSTPPSPMQSASELPVGAATGMGSYSGTGRPRVQIPTNGHLHPDGRETGHPNLHIHISPKDPSAIFSKRNTSSPTDSYPSPPPSLDSPPSNTVPIGYLPLRAQQHLEVESLTVGHVSVTASA